MTHSQLRKRALFLALVVAVLESGCGAMNYLPGSSTSGSVNTNGTTTYTTSGGTVSDPSSASGTETGTQPITMQVSGVGYDSVTVSVPNVTSVLKVEFTPGVQNGTVSGTNFAPIYSGLGVYINVGSLSQPTPLLHNGADGTNVETSGVMDYSSALSGTTGSVVITVTKPNYDYWCLNYGEYCPWTQVYPTHPWNGTLRIQTDYTDSL
jgi:hypothetical protein